MHVISFMQTFHSVEPAEICQSQFYPDHDNIRGFVKEHRSGSQNGSMHVTLLHLRLKTFPFSVLCVDKANAQRVPVADIWAFVQ